MPRINAMSDAEVAAVKAFLAKGGRVVADELPGGCDELGVKRAANPFEGLAGVAVTGKNFDDLDKAQRAATLKALEESVAKEGQLVLAWQTKLGPVSISIAPASIGAIKSAIQTAEANAK